MEEDQKKKKLKKEMVGRTFTKEFEWKSLHFCRQRVLEKISTHIDVSQK